MREGKEGVGVEWMERELRDEEDRGKSGVGGRKKTLVCSHSLSC